jgi:hypothetical protein
MIPKNEKMGNSASYEEEDVNANPPSTMPADVEPNGPKIPDSVNDLVTSLRTLATFVSHEWGLVFPGKPISIETLQEVTREKDPVILEYVGSRVTVTELIRILKEFTDIEKTVEEYVSEGKRSGVHRLINENILNYRSEGKTIDDVIEETRNVADYTRDTARVFCRQISLLVELLLRGRHVVIQSDSVECLFSELCEAPFDDLAIILSEEYPSPSHLSIAINRKSTKISHVMLRKYGKYEDPIRMAAEAEFYEFLEYLLTTDYPVAVTPKTNVYWTALMCVCEDDRPDLALRLIDRIDTEDDTADYVNWESDGETALTIAIRKKQVDVVNRLLDRGDTNVMVRTAGHNVIHHMIKSGIHLSDDRFTALINRARLEEDAQTFFHDSLRSAWAYNDTGMVASLLSNYNYDHETLSHLFSDSNKRMKDVFADNCDLPDLHFCYYQYRRLYPQNVAAMQVDQLVGKFAALWTQE